MDPPGARARHRSTPPHGGVREDCWSEGATEALVEAWGDRYVELKRGNLRQKDWQDVADAVNEHQDALGRPRRTDVQCKNRIDTLKKKFKIEKGRRGPSQWSFFSRLEELIGPAAIAGTGTGSGSGSATLKKHQTPKSEPNRMPPQRQGLTLKLKNRPGSNARPLAYRMDSPPGSSERSHGDSADGVDDDGDDYDDVDDRRDEDDDDADGHEGRGLLPLGMMSVPKKRRWDGGLMDGGGGAEDAFGELAKAIVKFGEIYERVESSKQQQIMEMERQRMEFAKDLEFQRMQMFMETQLELEKMKRPKYTPNNSKRS